MPVLFPTKSDCQIIGIAFGNDTSASPSLWTQAPFIAKPIADYLELDLTVLQSNAELMPAPIAAKSVAGFLRLQGEALHIHTMVAESTDQAQASYLGMRLPRRNLSEA
mmetsp:Transcript_66180/g.183236  ORF Transcript_66180/g.183236 Transcript_66180/m.183236 type:complete len:108 (-) Transcript_66180:605-928(-)